MTSSRVEPASTLRPDRLAPGERTLAVEAPVAIEVDGLGYAVMMMTPADLPAFAVGFMLTERLADTAADVADVDVFEGEAGWIVRVTLAERCRGRIHDRVRHRTSDTSCGLCGIAGLEQLRRPVAGTPDPPRAAPAALFAALANLRAHQPLNAATGAVHAAAACDAAGRILLACEDVGRHNALDKLIGRFALDRTRPDFILVTSRLSFEMVDKALVAHAPMLVGVSAPTTLAVEHARQHGLTLIALARPDAMLVMHDPHGLYPPSPCRGEGQTA
jgi:FdhD protein